jgi:hypothetical protein
MMQLPFVGRFMSPGRTNPKSTKFFSDHLGQAIGEPFRGSIMLWNPDYPTLLSMAGLWVRAIPTIDEYSQVVTPQALYFIHMLFKKNVLGHLNWFLPNLTDATYSRAYWEALRMLGVRYFMGPMRLPQADDIGTAPIELAHNVLEKEPPVWQIYELHRPYVGDFSPTEIVTARTAEEVMAALARPNFDFSRQVVLESEIGPPLTPARDACRASAAAFMCRARATAHRWSFFRSNSAIACARATSGCALCARTC